MSIGPISGMAMRGYATELGLDDFDERRIFCYLLRQMDAAYIEHLRPKDGK